MKGPSRFATWPRPTRRGIAVAVAAVVLGVAGFILASQQLVFGGVALLLLVASTLVAVGLRTPSVVVTRRFSPDRAVAGWDVTETLTLSTSGNSDLPVRVRETLAWRVMADDEAAETVVRRGRTTTVSFVHVDLPRGRHRIGPARVDVIESFGLAKRLVTVPGRTELVVFPEVIGIGAGRESRSLGEGSRQRRDHSVAGGQDDPITREYRRGDPMRRVHWRATARQGELMVRQEEQHGLPSARVVLPLGAGEWRDAHPALGSGLPVSDGFEWAVSAAASIAVEFGLAGSQTRVIGLDGGTIALHDPSTTPMFLEAMSDVALGDASDERSPDPSPREPVIAIVSSLGVDDLGQLNRLRGPGVPGVALVVHLDSELLSMPDTGPGAPAEIAEALRENGWMVVETVSNDDIREVLSQRGVLGG